MKIATYNIWNSEESYSDRMKLLIDLIKKENIDLIALQEVKDEEIVKKIKDECNYEYSYWKKYFDCEEGLAILSRFPMNNLWTNWDDSEDVHNSGLMYTTIGIEQYKVGIMNVHLDWKKVRNREIEIAKAIKHFDSQETDYDILLGDFNASDNSSIYNFLKGDYSLEELSTDWIDLAKAYSYMKGREVDYTLDFCNNPRWEEEYTFSIPERFDWILMKEPYPKISPKLVEYQLLGKERINNITPSDHYGVLVELKFTWS
jgi:endonuclease/exonuclease/phosphatase family metal-dependent hydrolase